MTPSVDFGALLAEQWDNWDRDAAVLAPLTAAFVKGWACMAAGSHARLAASTTLRGYLSNAGEASTVLTTLSICQLALASTEELSQDLASFWRVHAGVLVELRSNRAAYPHTLKLLASTVLSKTFDKMRVQVMLAHVHGCMHEQLQAGGVQGRHGARTRKQREHAKGASELDVLSDLLAYITVQAAAQAGSQASAISTLCFNTIMDILKQSVHAGSRVATRTMLRLVPPLCTMCGKQAGEAMHARCTMLTGVLESILEVAGDSCGPAESVDAAHMALMEVARHAHSEGNSTLLHLPKVLTVVLQTLATGAATAQKCARITLECVSLMPGFHQMFWSADLQAAGAGESLAHFWHAFLALYDGLSMYDVELVQDSWRVHWGVLLGAAQQVEQIVSDASVKERVQLEPKEQSGFSGFHGADLVAWICLLVTRGLQHANPCVQRFVVWAAVDAMLQGVVLPMAWVQTSFATKAASSKVMPKADNILRKVSQARGEAGGFPASSDTKLSQQGLFRYDPADATRAVEWVLSKVFQADSPSNTLGDLVALCDHLRQPRLPRASVAGHVLQLCAAIAAAPELPSSHVHVLIDHVLVILKGLRARQGVASQRLSKALLTRLFSACNRNNALELIRKVAGTKSEQDWIWECFCHELPSWFHSTPRYLHDLVTGVDHDVRVLITEPSGQMVCLLQEAGPLLEQSSACANILAMVQCQNHDKHVASILHQIFEAVSIIDTRPYLAPALVQSRLLLLEGLLKTTVKQMGIGESSLASRPSTGSGSNSPSATRQCGLVRLGLPFISSVLPMLCSLASSQLIAVMQRVDGIAATTGPEQIHWAPPHARVVYGVPADTWAVLHKAALLLSCATNALVGASCSTACPHELIPLQVFEELTGAATCAVAHALAARQASAAATNPFERELCRWFPVAAGSLCTALSTFAIQAGPNGTEHVSSLRLCTRKLLSSVGDVAGLPRLLATADESTVDVPKALSQLPWRLLDSITETHEILCQQAGQEGVYDDELRVLAGLGAAAIMALPHSSEQTIIAQLHCCRRVMGYLLKACSGGTGATLLQEQARVLCLGCKVPMPSGLAHEAGSVAEDAMCPRDHLDFLVRRLHEAALTAITGKGKRAAAVVTAALHTCMPADLFPRSCHHKEGRLIEQLHQSGSGAIPQLVRRLLDIGSTANRVAALTSLQLCRQLQQAPDLVGNYIPQIEYLIMWTPPSLHPEYSSACAMKPDAALKDSSLDRWPDPDVTQLVAESQDEPHAPRVPVLCLLHYLATADDVAAASGYAPCKVAGELVLHRLKDTLANDSIILQDDYLKGGNVHKKKIRFWQAFCCLAPLLASTDEVLELVLDRVSHFELVSVKQYQEQVLEHVLLQHPGYLRSHILPLLTRYSSTKPHAVPSLLLVAFKVATMRRRELDGDRIIPDLVSASLPWAGAHQHLVRCVANVAVRRLLDHAPPATDPCWQGITAADALSLWYHSATTNPAALKLEASLSGSTLGSSRLACHPTSVLASDSGSLEAAPVHMVDQVNRFLEQERGVTRGDATAKECAPALNLGADTAERGYQRKVDVIPCVQGSDHEGAGLVHALSMHGQDSIYLGEVQGQPHGLIVVASLVTKPANLGGLARTCEVFAAERLVVASLDVQDEVAFKAVSMTAERWVPMEAVAATDLQTWLEGKKRSGYALVGLEQTSRSVQLTAHKFCQATVLVLGEEMAGIPATVLPVLDECVEVQQHGRVRSLNVHVSAALAIHEYSTQLRT